MSLITFLFFALFGAYLGKWMTIVIEDLLQYLLDKEKEDRRSFISLFKKLIPSKKCPYCQKNVPWQKNLPLLGYILSKKGCACLSNQRSLRALFLEGGTALIFSLSSVFFPLKPALFFVLIASCILLCCFITDFEYGILPDELTQPLIWLGLISSLHPIFITPHEAIISAACGYAMFWGSNALYYMLRKKDGIYPGDFKLNAGIGACVGFKALFPILLASCASIVLLTFFTLLLKGKISNRTSLKKEYLDKEIPYGCFASLVTITTLYILCLDYQ